MGTKVSQPRIREPKKMKQVVGNSAKLRKLKELKSVNKEIKAENKRTDDVFAKSNKLHTKRRKLEEQLGI